MSQGTTQSARLARFLVVTLVVIVAAVGFAYASTDWATARGFAMARFSGWVASIGLAFGLALRPLSKISQLRGLSAWRRAIGICTAIAASAHVSLSLLGPLDGAWNAVLTWPHLQAGALAFAILTLLFITSFPRVVRALRLRHWKVLHRLVYAAALFVVAHLMLSPWGSVVYKSVLCALVLTLLLLRVRLRK